MQAETGLLYGYLLQQRPAGAGAIMQAQMHPALIDVQRQLDVHCIQAFRSDVLELQQAGIRCTDHLQGSYAWCALLPLKNRQQMLAAIADAWKYVAEGGRLIIVAANRGGARSLHGQLALLGEVSHVSRAKCRLMIVRRHGEPTLLQQWRDAAAPRRSESHGMWTRPGLFSWDRLDTGSRLLLQQLPASLDGEGMDLCCGYGVLAASLLSRISGITQLHALDADSQALAMAKRNLVAWKDRVRFHWLDATSEPVPSNLDWLVCNPPFHRGLQRQMKLGQKILVRACHSLRPGGRLWVVANRQLPYEAIMREHCASCEVLVQQHGFKVLYGVGR